MTDPVFFEPSRRFSAGDVATLTGASLTDSLKAGVEISGLAPVSEGAEGALVYLEARRGAPNLSAIRAAAILCPADIAPSAPDHMAVLVSARPRYDFALIGRMLFPTAARPAPVTGETGISSAAHIDPSAHLEDGVVIEPGAVIGRNASIGRGTLVAPNAVIGAGCRIGRDGYVGPGAVIQYALIGDRVIIHGGVQIGQDGFGFVAGQRGAEKIPHIGRVIVQDDVEIGANTTIDRGAISDTVIGEGSKIDNLVQIAHNVRIGRSCLIAGHCGLSGSVTLGDGVMLGGRVGLADHLTIGSGAAVAAGSGLMDNIPPGERWGGVPAKPIKEAMREVAVLKRLAQQSRRRGKDHG